MELVTKANTAENHMGESREDFLRAARASRPPTEVQMTQAKAIAKQARAFNHQFDEGSISLSEFFYASTALYYANKELIDLLHDTPGSEQEL